MCNTLLLDRPPTLIDKLLNIFCLILSNHLQLTTMRRLCYMMSTRSPLTYCTIILLCLNSSAVTSVSHFQAHIKISSLNSSNRCVKAKPSQRSRKLFIHHIHTIHFITILKLDSIMTVI